MANLALRPLTVLVALFVVVGAAGCSKSSAGGVSNAPAGINQPVWNDYCTRNATLMNTVQRALNGSLSAASLAPILNGLEQSITKDANTSQDPTKSQLVALVSAIDGVRVSVTTGVEPDYRQITAAQQPIPTCQK